jgi:hypothetical protein
MCFAPPLRLTSVGAPTRGIKPAAMQVEGAFAQTALEAEFELARDQIDHAT